MLFSPACERNKQPILAVLRDWLSPGSRVLEIGSGSGQHATYFCSQIDGLHWQTSERPDALADLGEALAALSGTPRPPTPLPPTPLPPTPLPPTQLSASPQSGTPRFSAPLPAPPGSAQPLARGSRLPPPLPLDVTCPGDWPRRSYDAVFTANTCHILPEAALPHLLAGSRRVLHPGGLLLLYGPFHDRGVHTAESNAAFDAHLRSLDPAMGVRDALALQELARGLGLEPLADVARPANNRMLILRAAGAALG